MHPNIESPNLEDSNSFYDNHVIGSKEDLNNAVNHSAFSSRLVTDTTKDEDLHEADIGPVPNTVIGAKESSFNTEASYDLALLVGEGALARALEGNSEPYPELPETAEERDSFEREFQRAIQEMGSLAGPSSPLAKLNPAAGTSSDETAEDAGAKIPGVGEWTDFDFDAGAPRPGHETRAAPELEAAAPTMHAAKTVAPASVSGADPASESTTK